MPQFSPYNYALNNPLIIVDAQGKYPKPSEILADFGIKPEPMIAGLMDGFVEGLGVVDAAEFAYNLATDPKFRDQLFESFKVIASDPLAFAVTIAKSYVEKGQEILSGSEKGHYELGHLVGEFAGGVVTGGAVAKLIKFADDFKLSKLAQKTIKSKPCGCFVIGTLVLTNNGYKQIQEIVIGDSVWAYSDSLQELKLQCVIEIFTREFDEYFRIYFNNQFLDVTHEHPFLINGIWKKAQDLNINDTLTTFDGRKVLVDSINFIQSKELLNVYNFIVEGYHTYYVSGSNILVHNGNPCELTNFVFSKAKGASDWFSKGLHGRVSNKIEIKYQLDDKGNIFTQLSQSKKGLTKENIKSALKEGLGNLNNIDFLKKSIAAIDDTLKNVNTKSFGDGTKKLENMKKALENRLNELNKSK